MGEKATVRTREKQVDDVKVIACILVVLGHFFQSMTKAKILPESDLYDGLTQQSIIFMFRCFSFVVGTCIKSTVR